MITAIVVRMERFPFLSASNLCNDRALVGKANWIHVLPPIVGARRDHCFRLLPIGNLIARKGCVRHCSGCAFFPRVYQYFPSLLESLINEQVPSAAHHGSRGATVGRGHLDFTASGSPHEDDELRAKTGGCDVGRS